MSEDKKKAEEKAEVKAEVKAAEHHGIKPAFEVKNHKEDAEYFLKHSKLNNKGDTLSMTQSDFEKFFENHGVARADLERVKAAFERADVGMTVAAGSLLQKNIQAAIKNGEDASKLSASFKGHTSAFAHSAKVTASQSEPMGMIQAGEKPQRKTVYGKIRTGLDVRGSLPKDLVEGAAAATRKTLGV